MRAVGKHDRRNSMKMKRRKAQVKKKARLKRQTKERKAAPGGAAKKPATRRKTPVAAPISGPPPTTPTGTVPVGLTAQARVRGYGRGAARSAETHGGKLRRRGRAIARRRRFEHDGLAQQPDVAVDSRLVDELPAVLVVPALLDRRHVELLLLGAVPRHANEDLDVVLAPCARMPASSRSATRTLVPQPRWWAVNAVACERRHVIHRDLRAAEARVEVQLLRGLLGGREGTRRHRARGRTTRRKSEDRRAAHGSIRHHAAPGRAKFPARQSTVSVE